MRQGWANQPETAAAPATVNGEPDATEPLIPADREGGARRLTHEPGDLPSARINAMGGALPSRFGDGRFLPPNGRVFRRAPVLERCQWQVSPKYPSPSSPAFSARARPR